MVRAAPGWASRVETDAGALELVILEGRLTVGEVTVGAGGFVALPKASGAFEMSSSVGFQAIAIWSPHFERTDYYDGEPQITRVWDIPWQGTQFPGEIDQATRLHGVLSKSLRWPDPVVDDVHGGPKGLLRLVAMAPGFIGDHRAESHPGCWEEIIWLTGDFLMPGTGIQAAGSYVANPADYVHGPLLTQRGAVLLVHTDTPAGFCFHEPPIAADLIDRYMDDRSWLDAPVHTPWASCPESSERYTEGIPDARVAAPRRPGSE